MSNGQSFKFHVYHPPELAAGIRSFDEDVEVTFTNGLAPGTEQEFTEAFQDFLREWFDTKQVYTEETWNKIVNHDDH
jgi:hypothetical protein